MTDPYVPIVPGGPAPTLSQMMPAPVVKPPRQGPPRWFWPLMTVTFVILGAGGLAAFILLDRATPTTPVAAAETPSPTPPARPVLALAKQSCNAGELSDYDKTLYLDMKGDDAGSGAADETDLVCLLNYLQTPSYVVTEMSKTRALDGRQEQTWGTLKASWTYHPDNGLDVIIRDLG